MKYFLILLALFPFSLVSQDLTPSDYQRAESFLWENLVNKQAFNVYLTAEFFPDSSGMWFVTYSSEGKSFQMVSLPENELAPLFDHQRLADSLSVVLEDQISPQKLPFDRVSYLSPDTLSFYAQGNTYVWEKTTYRITKKTRATQKDSELSSTSPNGRWKAFPEEYNLSLQSTSSEEVFKLSTKGSAKYRYGSYYGWDDLMKGEGGKRPDRFQVDWSPNSKWLLAYICDVRQAEKMYLLDYSVDTLFRPQLYSYYRGSPGDTTLVQMIPRFYEVETKSEVPISLEKRGYIHNYVHWWFESADKVLLADMKRGYKKRTFHLLDLKTGRQERLFEEVSDTRLGRSIGGFLFEKYQTFVHLSEQSGWQHLYGYNFQTQEHRPLTQGNFIVHRTILADTSLGYLYLEISGIQPRDNPYHTYLARVSITGGELELLTPETGNHSVRMSPDGAYFLDEFSTHSSPPIFYLREASTGKILKELAQAKIDSLDQRGWSPPQAFSCMGRDGQTHIHGVVYKPTHFDPSKSYPVIDNSYTGPHTNMFPNRFVENFYGGLQDLAELGFLVVKIDGMGTYGRSKAFHDVSYKNMGQNLLDHVLAIKYLGKTYTWVDTTRVGIFGHSAGGYDAGHGLLAFPDFYKVGVASSADHDFRMEKAWWPEMYMGWPVDSSYHQASNITLANNLKGKLLITHGGMDENVNPSATFKLAEALIQAGKEFDMLIFPSQHHGYRGKTGPYFTKKRWNYFVEHLLGVKPLWEWSE